MSICKRERKNDEEQCEFREHSGQMFDWWKCSNEGQIVKVPKPPQPPEPYRFPPLRKDQLCWPMYQTQRFPTQNQQNNAESEENGISKDYWPEKGTTVQVCKKTCKLEYARPPWIPAKNPNSRTCPVSLPPSTKRQKTVVTVVSRP